MSRSVYTVDGGPPKLNMNFDAIWYWLRVAYVNTTETRNNAMEREFYLLSVSVNIALFSDQNLVHMVYWKSIDGIFFRNKMKNVSHHIKRSTNYINEVSFYSILDMKDRTYINSAAERLCLKLEALDVSKVHISPLKLLAVQVEVSITLFKY